MRSSDNEGLGNGSQHNPADGLRTKKPYTSPQIVEWGSITDLTLGQPFTGNNDFPKKGGSRFV